MPQNMSLFFTDKVKQKWLDMVPSGLGYQIITNPEKLEDLPTPLPEYAPKMVFTTSMTHQLHCLVSLLYGDEVRCADGIVCDGV